MKEKMVNLTPSEQHKLQVRFNKLKGQLAAVEGLLVSPMPYAGTLQQLSAVNGALKAIMREILELSVRSEVAGLAQQDVAHNADDIILAMRSFLK